MGKIAAPYLATTLLYACVVLAVEESLGDHLYKDSGQIGSVFGIAVAFLMGFRMNSAYDRWWEARKIVGELTNTTRSFCCKLVTYLGDPANLKAPLQTESVALTRELLGQMRHYLTQLQHELLDQPSLGPGSLAILQGLSIRLEAVLARDIPLEKSDLMQHINRFYEIQGRAERIKNTPFLMLYGASTHLIVLGYVLLMPLFIGDLDLGGEASSLEYLALPILAVVSTIFLSLNKLANLTGEPFSGNATSLPLASLLGSLEAHCAAAQAH